MKNNNELSAETKNGNLDKPMLALAFLFKTKKLCNYEKNVFGYQNAFFRILRNTKHDYYYYGFFDVTSQKYLQAHKGIKLRSVKPWMLSIFSVIFSILTPIPLFIAFIITSYFDGGKNFIKDSAWYQNVRFFNWANIVLLIILFARMLLQS
ncbi:MAG: hypothetical protein K2Y30_16650 [Flavobacteriaceae bacterium]|nr:hypothetical protein [Flavobacteriaceae bacterium]